jgi:hypothetical protein
MSGCFENGHRRLILGQNGLTFSQWPDLPDWGQAMA